MVNILIAPDKFKGSLTAPEVCAAIKEGLQQKYPDANITAVPLADGGEGTCELLTSISDGYKIEKIVNGPLFDPVKADYGISKDGTIAFVEMARASGLQLLKPGSRNPLLTTTYGTGELIHDALDRGVKKIVLGIGGSATNDAGIGMANALGFDFYSSSGNTLKPIGENLIHLHTINAAHTHPRLKTAEFITLCDVDNPLFGPDGAAFTYGPQKGADEKMVKLLDAGLRQFANVAVKFFKQSPEFPGAGAAGGLGAGSKFFLNAQLHKGMEFIINATGLEEKIRKADVIISGEGKLDFQTLSGKVVTEVSKIAQRFGKPVIIICGKCELPSDVLKKLNFDTVIPLVNDSTSLEQSMEHAYDLIKDRIAANVIF